MRRLARAAAGVLLLAASRAAPTRTVLDGFEQIAGWIAAPSEGVRLTLSSERGEGEGALRLDFDFQGRAGWAAARKAFPRGLPENWVFTLRLKGDAPPETLEFKLLDPTGKSVWWSVRRNFAFPREWKTLRIRRRQVSFAWGPAGGGEIRDLGAIEIAITAGSGGKGTVWLDELALEELPAPAAVPARPVLRASSSAAGNGPERALDGNPETAWQSDPEAGERQELVLDLGGRRELGGLRLDWDPRDYPVRFAIDVSDDAAAWCPAREVAGSPAGRVWVYLPEAEAAYVRLRLEESSRSRGYGLAELAVEPPSFSETPTAFLQAVAAGTARGQWPRSLRGEQIYWALVGVDGGTEKGLLSEDGALETSRGSFSLEPFLQVDDRLLGWAEAETSQSLADGDLPIPSVTRRYPGKISLEVTALADGPSESPTLRTRYRVGNAGGSPLRATLYLALRPVQVNPPWQFLNTPGGFAPVRRVTREGRAAVVDGKSRVVPLSQPSAFGASSFDGGEIVSWLSRGKIPDSPGASDADGFASAAFAWRLEVPARGVRDIVVAAPLEGAGEPEKASDPKAAGRDFQTRLSAAGASWRGKLDRVELRLPPETASLSRAVRSNLAWILVNRDGPAIQPGSRCYARSWIRDGALTGAALLRLGHEGEVREFLDWFAAFQFESGAVPCCVDRRGADPVPENDSHGELLFLAAEYFRFTSDRATVERLWPRLEKAAAFIDALRRSRRTEEYRSGPRRLFFGLLPESISHEGYSNQPVHSYWDDFWALRGLSDAAELAGALGKEDEAARLAASRDELRADLHASVRQVIAARGIDYVPGSADLGDFDATSTTIALEPGGEGSRLPPRELQRTFGRYWEEFVSRRDAEDPGNSYTPYEWRVAGSFVRLGWRDRAQALSDFFLRDRRPAAWNQWAEIVHRDARAPKFVGDMPHSWVGSDFIRSFLDRFAWERREDGALVLAAGIPRQWARAPGGVSIRGLRTRWGPLDFSAREENAALRLWIGGRTAVPPGGFVLRPPLAAVPASVTVNGRAVPSSGAEEIRVREAPAVIVISR